MADALSKLQAGADKARAKLAVHRLGGRERTVAIRTITEAGGNPALGIAPTRTTADSTITPTPSVRDGGFKLIQYAEAHGGRLEDGDILVDAISRSYSEEQLRSADAWLVDGVEYSLIRLAGKPTEWEAFLRRA
ncbi:hypothetical protein D3C87_1100140 [compost metagenome]